MHVTALHGTALISVAVSIRIRSWILASYRSCCLLLTQASGYKLWAVGLCFLASMVVFFLGDILGPCPCGRFCFAERPQVICQLQFLADVDSSLAGHSV